MYSHVTTLTFTVTYEKIELLKGHLLAFIVSYDLFVIFNNANTVSAEMWLLSFGNHAWYKSISSRVHWLKNCAITFNLHDKLFYSATTIVLFNNVIFKQIWDKFRWCRHLAFFKWFSNKPWFYCFYCFKEEEYHSISKGSSRICPLL